MDCPDDEIDIGDVSAGAAGSYPFGAGQLRKGMYVVLEDRPCKVMEMTTSKPGKHGHAKVNVTGIDIFTERKLVGKWPSSHNVQVPYVKNCECQVMGLDDQDYLSLLYPDNLVRNDCSLPPNECGHAIRGALDEWRDLIVTVCSALGETQIVGFKDAPTL